MRAALQAHSATAEAEIEKARAEPAGGGKAIDDGDVSDGDDGHIAAKETMRRNVKRIFEEKPANMDEEFGEAAQDDGCKLPTGEIVPAGQARAVLEKRIGADVLQRAVDFLGRKLSDDDGNALRDPAVQRELTAILGANAAYASAVSKLVLVEASA